MNALTERQLQVHVPVVGWLLIVSHALYALIGGLVCTLMLTIAIAVQDAEASPIVAFVGIAVAGLFVVLGIPGLVAGLGVLARKNWGRILAIVVAVLNVLNFPVGTLLGAYALWVLLQEAASDYFAPAKAPEAPAAGEQPADDVAA
ncbi:MAG TPA: hypothetical protein PLJ35_10765 [Anaerolineae bacterium]|nr:hypothetical protein [Anaerolineae bacterium]HOQ99288.1 hypothetical protein [Anaerolineae bacterium]HPL26922.1 hypothetical protein [Anaerolineae bacterium]